METAQDRLVYFSGYAIPFIIGLVKVLVDLVWGGRGRAVVTKLAPYFAGLLGAVLGLALLPDDSLAMRALFGLSIMGAMGIGGHSGQKNIRESLGGKGK